jgi:hypothetical protein
MNKSPFRLYDSSNAKAWKERSVRVPPDKSSAELSREFFNVDVSFATRVAGRMLQQAVFNSPTLSREVQLAIPQCH